ELARIPEAQGRDETRRDALAGRGGAAMAVLSEEQRIRQNINSLLEEQAVDAEQINKLNQENLSLQERTNQALQAGGNLVKDTADKVSGVGKALKEIESIDVSNLFSIDPTELQKSVESGYKTISEQLKNSGNIVNVPVKLDFTPE